MDNDYAIKWASENGYFKVVKLLLEDERVYPGVDNNYAIKRAIINGHIEIVKVLLKDNRVSPELNNNQIILTAHKSNQLYVVKELLCHDKVSHFNNYIRKIIVINTFIDLFNNMNIFMPYDLIDIIKCIFF